MEIFILLALFLGLLTSYFVYNEAWLSCAWGSLLLNSPGCSSPPRGWLKKPISKEDYIKAYRNNTGFSLPEQKEGGLASRDRVVFGGGGKELKDDWTEAARPSQNKGGNGMTEVQQVAGIELLKVPVVIGENTVQRMEISDVELDFTAQKIRHIDAHINDLTYEIIQDKVIIQGQIQKQVFYVGVDNVVHHQAEQAHFSFFVDIPGAEPGMMAQIYPRVEFIKPELLQNGDLLHQKMVIELFVKVTEVRQVFLETATSGPLLKVERVIGENASQTLVEGEVTLPIPAIKVTDIQARITDLVTEIIEDKVIVQGVIAKQVFFIGEDDIEHHFDDQLSFSHFIDVPGAESYMNVQLKPVIEHIKPELDFDGVTLRQEVILELFVKVTETVQLHLIQGGPLLVKLPQVIGENTRQVMLESSLTFEQPAIKVKEVDARIENLRTVVLSGKVIIQGVIHKQVFFVGEDNVEYHQAEELPFSTFIEVPGAEPDMAAQVNWVVEHLRPEFNEIGDILHQKIMLEFFVKVTEEVQIYVRPVEVQPYEPYLE